MCLMSILCIGYAKVRIEITQGVDIAHPIGIIPFQWKADEVIPENIDKIISADFCNTGKFYVLPESRLPQRPTNVSEINPINWSSIGIYVIIIGQLELIGNDNYVITYQLVNTSGQSRTIILHNKYKVNKKWLRYAAHTISDEVFEKLTGIKGIFCTRIAYIVHWINHNKYPYELYISDYDGYNQISIYRSSEPLMSPSWSPDGDTLVYVTFVNRHAVLMMHTLSNGDVRQVANFPQHNGAPSFSPDGKKIAFALSKTGSLNIYIMDLISGKISQITNNRNNNTEPNWFPDGQNLVYTSDYGGSPQIYKINIINRESQRLSWSGISNQNAIVSTDGKFLILVNKNKTQHIAKLDLSTGAIQILTNTLLDETPSLSPNDNMIIYSTMQSSGYILQLISTDGKFKAYLPITDGGEVRFPAWSPYL
nr:Tol-Pal system beta propeller repeat protein TolB [Blochmannia endosymbiont of Camponotus (Colobopsis) obliquus]